MAASIVVALWMRDGDGDVVPGQLDWAIRSGKATVVLVESGLTPLDWINPKSLIEFACRDPFPAVERLNSMSDQMEVGLLPRDAFKPVFADLAMVLLAFCLD